MNKSIDYYNKNSERFYTVSHRALDVSAVYARFLTLIPSNGIILDAGCGVGRDVCYFSSKGYRVTAFDASIEMIKLAKKESGQEILLKQFSEIEYDRTFDAVWACRSLLHVSYDEMNDAILRLHKSLHKAGIFYSSFKYGDTQVTAQGRDFFNMNEERIKKLLSGLFDIIEIWIVECPYDVEGVISRNWIHVLARKK